MSQLKLRSIFGVIAEPQSYINILYLLLGLPLGIAYFVFLVTGISLGFGMLIIIVGFPILALVLAGSWAMCEFERILAVRLLKEDIPPTPRGRSTITDDQDLSSVERHFLGSWRLIKSHLTDRLTWTGILYLFLKFPLGIASFTFAVTLIALTFALLGAPFYYWVDAEIELGIWQIDEQWEGLIAMLVGLPSLFVSIHLMNVIAILLGRLARVMLGPIGQTETGDTGRG